MRASWPAPVGATHHLFCAVDVRTLDPKVFVEAKTTDEAKQRVNAVLHWFGIGSTQDVLVTLYDGPCCGVPMFLDGFFSAWDGAVCEAAAKSSQAEKQ